MKNELVYLITRNEIKKGTILFNNFDLVGYKLFNNRKKEIQGFNISNVLIVNDFLIKKVIEKKINRKLKSLLELIADFYENDEDSGNGRYYVLNEIEKFKRIMINEYVVYMDKKQVEKLKRKLKLIEQEVSVYTSKYKTKYEEEVYEEEKSNHRRR